MNHINLSVPDVPKTRAFLETYFDLRCSESPHPEKIVVMMDPADDNIIAISNFSSKTEDYNYPAAFHIGFNLPSREDVDAMHSRFVADGYSVGRQTEFHGAWTFYLKAPGGFMIEVFHQYGMDELKAALR